MTQNRRNQNKNKKTKQHIYRAFSFQVKEYIVQHWNQQKMNENDEIVDEIDGFAAIPESELPNWMRLA